MNPKIVCLCGSTRFMEEYTKASREFTLKGYIVLSVGLFGHQEGLDMEGETKKKLDELHLRKIDMADEVFVINGRTHVCDKCNKIAIIEDHYVHERGYIARTACCHTQWTYAPYVGESTKREIKYAKDNNKPITYLCEISNG